MRNVDPYVIQSNAINLQIGEEVQRIDAYLLGYLKKPTQDRLEYMTYLLKRYLDRSPKFHLESAKITYETEPSDFSFKLIFPVDKESTDVKELREEVLKLNERNGRLIRELNELKKAKYKKATQIEQPPSSWLGEEDLTSITNPSKPKEKLNQAILDYKGLQLPYVIEEGQVWFLTTPTLKALGIGEHFIKRTHLGASNKRRDLNIQGVKRPSLINFEALDRIAKNVSRHGDYPIEGLAQQVAGLTVQ